MTRTEIYNIALRQHGKRCTEQEVTSEDKPYEVRLCDDVFRSAVHKVLGEHNWSSRTVPVYYDKDFDFPERGWRHGYLLPQGLLRVIPRSTNPYLLMGTKFLTDEDDPVIYGIMDNFDPEIETDDMCNLVGLAMAYELCGIIAPADNAIASMIIQKYSWTMAPMISADCPAQRRSIEEGGALEF